jgi:hypothetical protein
MTSSLAVRKNGKQVPYANNLTFAIPCHFKISRFPVQTKAPISEFFWSYTELSSCEANLTISMLVPGRGQEEGGRGVKVEGVLHTLTLKAKNSKLVPGQRSQAL